MLTGVGSSLRDVARLCSLPRVTINLMHSETASNDPFYERVVSEFYAETRQRHPKLPLVRQFEFGVALCKLPGTFEEYFRRVEPSGQRNVRKAKRLGYTFGHFDFNNHLEDIKRILESTAVRQGKAFEAPAVVETHDPPSRNPLHDYPCFGVMREGKVLAYGTCCICGEVGMIQRIFGHEEHLADGVVPMLVVGIAQKLYEKHPHVRYYMYGTFFGAGPTMRRFKKKFAFEPHNVTWQLG